MHSIHVCSLANYKTPFKKLTRNNLKDFGDRHLRPILKLVKKFSSIVFCFAAQCSSFHLLSAESSDRLPSTLCTITLVRDIERLAPRPSSLRRSSLEDSMIFLAIYWAWFKLVPSQSDFQHLIYNLRIRTFREEYFISLCSYALSLAVKLYTLSMKIKIFIENNILGALNWRVVWYSNTKLSL